MKTWTVEVDVERIAVVDPQGSLKVLAREALARIVIETNDSGPFSDDAWWLLLRDDGTVALKFPQSADGEHDVIESFLDLPGFNYEAMVTAMGSTEQGFFPVWRREA
ncbi:MAG: hypothetical protein AB7P20_09990 [Rhizobiaceae bacterium]